MSIPTSSFSVETPVESASSAVSWGPVIAGAVAATALTMVLVLIGAGLGLTMVSPFAGQSSSAGTVSLVAGIWVVLVQWFSAAFGGYLAGRLRNRWTGLHTNEVYFRDTAHGFMTWAVSTLLVAFVVTSTLSSVIGTGAQATAAIVGTTGAAAATAAADQMSADPTSYLTDSLLRPADPAAAATSPTAGDPTAQVSRILLNAVVQGEMPAADRTYLEGLVAARTGLSPADAGARIDSVLKQAEETAAAAQQAVEAAREATATASFLAALSLLIGAVIASVAGAIGGRQRDDDDTTYSVR